MCRFCSPIEAEGFNPVEIKEHCKHVMDEISGFLAFHEKMYELKRFEGMIPPMETEEEREFIVKSTIYNMESLHAEGITIKRAMNE